MFFLNIVSSFFVFKFLQKSMGKSFTYILFCDITQVCLEKRNNQHLILRKREINAGFSGKTDEKMKIDNMYYNMYYSDKLQPDFNCFSSPNLKSFNGILIPKEERIMDKSGSSRSLNL